MAERGWIGEQLFNLRDDLNKLDLRIKFLRSILMDPERYPSPDYEAHVKRELSGLYDKYADAHFKGLALINLIEPKP